MRMPEDWIVPDWPAPAGVGALCSTRAGGVSRGPYESLNLGDHVGDDAVSVAQNRMTFARTAGVRPVYMKQVHGTAGVVELDDATGDGVEGDGCVASSRGVGCTIMVADCLPVLFATRDGMRVGAAHAGWRGLAGGIVESTVLKLHAQPDSVMAWLGPCIGPEAFEVGPEVKAAFEAHDVSASDAFRPDREGKWLADLPALMRMRLRALGITQIFGNDGTQAWCTVANESRFFSHRRDRVSGRFAACVWRR